MVWRLQVGRAGIEVKVQCLLAHFDRDQILAIILLWSSGSLALLSAGSGALDGLGHSNAELFVGLLHGSGTVDPFLANADLVDLDTLGGLDCWRCKDTGQRGHKEGCCEFGVHCEECDSRMNETRTESIARCKKCMIREVN